MRTKIFVYGTLMSGFDNEFANYLHQNVEEVIPAFIAGELYIVTKWLFPYPVAEYRSTCNAEICGELLVLKKNIEKTELFEKLDEYEGVDISEPEIGEYIRTEVKVKTKDDFFRAWAYVNNAPNLKLEKITSGDFKKYLSENV